MTDLLEPLEESSYTTFKGSNHNIDHRHRKVLKPKKNTYKHKCKQVLKKKLKKYKLRQDGKEDQDIIDVSNTLVSSLFIRSPNKQTDCNDQELDELRPKNYLFRMVRRKHSIITNSRTVDLDIKSDKNDLQECVNGDEKKQTNAFKLLMDSMNKSLGTNSPGKDKPIDELETQESIERKSIKAKRNLLLQKMAESKGSLKKKELEEQQEKYIKKKMEKRAEKLKNMIINKEPKTVKEDKKDLLEKSRSPLNTIETEKNEVLDKPIKTLQLVNIFSETVVNISPERKHIPKEDEEFLKKLSPSIKKKESMLSYFKKVEKDDSMTADSENDIIKVKLGFKKKKGKKKKLSLKRGIVSCDSQEIDHKVEEIVVIDEIEQNKEGESDQKVTNIAPTNKGTRKRKREVKSIPDTNGNINIECSKTDERPKRISKRPVKYTEEFCLSSSDEELQIFSPIKKKYIKNTTPKVINEKVDVDEDKSNPKKIVTEHHNKAKKSIKVLTPLKPVKLAPIFASKPNPAAIEAKQKFLQSGVPEQLKKIMSKQKENNNQSNDFLKVVHIQQLDKSSVEYPLKVECQDITNVEESLPTYEDNLFTKMLSKSSSQNVINLQSNTTFDAKTTLQNFKKSYPRFPVYRTYKLLRGKKKGEFRDSNIFNNMDNSVEILNCSIDMQNDNPDQLTWSDKYKSMSGNEIIGNFETIRELRKWLVAWTENSTKSKANDSDSSDYYQSDPDSRDSMKSNDNLLILSGPVGSGKTSSVYAVAAELRIKVIEVNASSKRTGKIMLQDLQEATQSHIVHRGTGSAENSQKSDEVIDLDPVKVKKRGRPKKVVEQPTLKREKIMEKNMANGQTNSQDTRSAMSLILIDDADIVFDQDDGFCSAIMQLVQSSKRPVILITGSLSCPHLQRFVLCSKNMKMHPLLPNMLGTWLDIMCLADSGACWPGLGAKILNLYKGDMRKTINCLQFYVCSLEQGLDGKSQTDSQNIEIEDESSSMSWADNHEERNLIAHNSLDSNWSWYTHFDENPCPNKIMNVWWSIPKMLYTSDFNINRGDQTDNIDKSGKNKALLESICNVLDSISISDYFSPKKRDAVCNIASDPWFISECDSVSELENLEYYNRNFEINSEISNEMVKGYLCTAQEKLGMNCKIDLDFPDMAARRKRDQTVSRHNNLTTYLSPQSSLDRKALALDYWSFCRNICRVEKSKTDTASNNNNSRRQNRHCHYLKSLSVLCKSDSFDSLASSLNTT